MEAVYISEQNKHKNEFYGWISDRSQFRRTCDSRNNDYELSVRIVHDGGLNQSRIEYNGYHQGWKRVVTNMDASEYFEKVMHNHPSVSMNKQVIGGMPAIVGSRIPVSLIVSCLRDGMGISDISEDYGIEEEKIRSALEFVIDILDVAFHED